MKLATRFLRAPSGLCNDVYRDSYQYCSATRPPLLTKSECRSAVSVSMARLFDRRTGMRCEEANVENFCQCYRLPIITLRSSSKSRSETAKRRRVEESIAESV